MAIKKTARKGTKSTAAKRRARLRKGALLVGLARARKKRATAGTGAAKRRARRRKLALVVGIAKARSRRAGTSGRRRAA